MNATWLALAITAVVLSPWRALALVTQHGREPVHSSSWVAGLDQVVNHPSRVGGMTGPYGLSGRFQFSGTTASFNEVLNAYAQVSQPVRILYLTPGPTPAGDGEVREYEVSITHEGQAFVHLHVSGTVDLEQLKEPSNIRMEFLPAVSGSTGPEAKRQEADAQRVIQEFLRKHNAISSDGTSAEPLKVGSIAPGLAALSADGNAINASAAWPEPLKAKTVLLIFWSANDTASVRQIEELKRIRTEFDREAFQMVSLCVDEQLAPWIRIVRQRVDYGRGEIHLHDDSKCWQVIQDPNASSTANRYGVVKLPAAFLVGPDRALMALNIPPSELRNTVAQALKGKPAP